MSDPYFPLIHCVMGMMDSFYYAPFAAVSYANDLSQVAASVSLGHARRDLLSLNDSALYSKTLP